MQAPAALFHRGSYTSKNTFPNSHSDEVHNPFSKDRLERKAKEDWEINSQYDQKDKGKAAGICVSRKVTQPKLKKIYVAINNEITSADTINEIFVRCKDRLEAFNHVNIATAIHRIAKKCEREKVTQPQIEFIQILGEHALKYLKVMEPRHITNTIWGLVTLKLTNKRLFLLISQEVQAKLESFEHKNIAITAWAFSKGDFKDERLFKAISAVALLKIKGFSSYDLSITAWAFAAHNLKDVELFRVIAEEALIRLPDFNPQDLSNTAWAFATIHTKDRKLFNSIAIEVLRNLQNFNIQEISIIAWSFANLNIKHEELFKALGSAALSKLKVMNALNISNLVWAFATLGIRHENFFKELSRTTLANIQGFSEISILNAAWAFAVLDLLTPELLNGLLSKHQKTKKLNQIDLTQLKFVYQYAADEKHKFIVQWPPSLLKAILKIDA